MKKKKIYEQPETAVTRVELESPICSGSVDIQNPDSNLGRIEEQKFNNDFMSGENDAFTTDWTKQ